MVLEFIRGGEEGDVEVLALFEETFVDVFVAGLFGMPKSKRSDIINKLDHAHGEVSTDLGLINCRCIAKHV